MSLAITSCSQTGDTIGGTELHKEAYLPADNLRLLTGRAGIIFKGVVSAIEFETDDNTGMPYTYVTFRQIEAIKDLTGKFKDGGNEKIRIRNFGGLREDGKQIEMSHIPNLLMGGVYVVFYSAGDWDVTPVVGGEKGVFRVLKSRTLGHEILLDYLGRAVVSISDDTIKTLPLIAPQEEMVTQPIEETDGKSVAKQNEREGQLKIDKNSIYTEENVKRMIEGEDELDKMEKEEGVIAKRDSSRAKMLTDLATPPMSFEAFSKAVLEVDRKYKNDFLKFYSKVDFEGKPVQKERSPIQLKQE